MPDRREFLHAATAAALGAGCAAAAAPRTRAVTQVIDVRDYGAVGDGAARDGAALQRALDAGAGTRVVVPRGVFHVDRGLAVAEHTQFELAPGATLACHARGGEAAITLGNGSRIAGFGPASQIIATEDCDVSSLVSNAAHDGTQEYCYIEGLTLLAHARARVAVALVDLVAVFVNSGIRGCVINANSTAPIGLRIAGGHRTGFGPVYVDDVWVAHAAGHNIVVTEENPSRGSATCWLTNITSEHQAAGHAGLYVRGFGGIYNVTIRNFHHEHGASVTQPVAAVIVDGVPGFTLDGADILASPIEGKSGIVITDNALNYRACVRGVQNVNGVDPIIDDRRHGQRLGARNVARYETADPGPTSGHADQVFVHLVQMPGGVATRTSAGVPSDDAPDGTLVVDTANSKLLVRVGGRWKSTPLT